MVETILFGLVLGLTAGIRFRVFVLFPAILLAIVWVAAWGLLAGETTNSILLTQFFAAMAVQLGYLGAALKLERPTNKQEVLTVPPAR